MDHEARARARTDELITSVYPRLRKLAQQLLNGEPAGQTLTATGLANEAYARLAGSPANQEWSGEEDLFRVLTQKMRRILTNRANRQSRVPQSESSFSTSPLATRASPASAEPDLSALAGALASLHAALPEAFDAIVHRYAHDLDRAQTANLLEADETQIKYRLHVAYRFLTDHMADRP